MRLFSKRKKEKKRRENKINMRINGMTNDTTNILDSFFFCFLLILHLLPILIGSLPTPPPSYLRCSIIVCTNRVCYCYQRLRGAVDSRDSVAYGPMCVCPIGAYSDDAVDAVPPSSFRVVCYATDVATYAIH